MEPADDSGTMPENNQQNHSVEGANAAATTPDSITTPLPSEGVPAPAAAPSVESGSIDGGTQAAASAKPFWKRTWVWVTSAAVAAVLLMGTGFGIGAAVFHDNHRGGAASTSQKEVDGRDGHGRSEQSGGRGHQDGRDQHRHDGTDSRPGSSTGDHRGSERGHPGQSDRGPRQPTPKATPDAPTTTEPAPTETPSN